MPGIQANIARFLGAAGGDRIHAFLLEAFLMILYTGVFPMHCLGEIGPFQEVREDACFPPRWRWLRLAVVNTAP